MRLIKYALVCYFIVFAVSVYATNSDLSAISNKVLKNTGINNSGFAFVLYDLKNNKEVYSVNQDKLLSIASVNKLFVTAASVNILGQDFRFKTKVYSNNKNIYIQGDGDPLFVSESMWYLVNRLVDSNIKEITGNIILDDSAFKTETIFDGESDRAYSARISPLSMNFNSIAINVVSGSNHNVNIDPNVPVISLKDKTSVGNGKTNVEIRRYSDDVVVSGKISQSEYALKTIYRNINDPLKYFAEVLKLHLKWRGIKFTGTVTSGLVPKDTNLLFEVESKRLCDLLADMNRFSNNFIAEQLLRAISLKVGGKPAEPEKGLTAIRNFLANTGMNSSDYNIVNASGFSKDNKSNAKAIISFLKYVYSDFQTRPELINSLSISGMDGTIKRTIDSAKLKGKVRAKSGTMSGIRGLAGYVNGQNSVYAFVLLANDANAHSLVDWEERILETVWMLP